MRDSGVTIILTTHYIEEAEEMADRVGVINKGELILVEEKTELMKKLGKKRADPQPRRADGDDSARARRMEPEPRKDGGHELLYVFDGNAERTGMPFAARGG